MRILFTCIPSYGHAYPLIPLAQAALEAGHDVRVATNAEFHPVLHGHGLPTVSAGLSAREAWAAAAPPDTPDLQTLPIQERVQVITTVIAKEFGDVLPRSFVADLIPLIDELRPDLMINEIGNHGGSLAARLAGVPELQHGFGRIAVYAFPGRPQLAELCAEHDMTVEDLNRADVLDVCPESLQDNEFLASGRTRVPLRPVAVTEPGERVDYRTTRPLVYLTLGTVVGTVPVLRTAIDGLAALDADILVAAGPTVPVDAIGEVPGSVRVLPWVRQADVLSAAALVVHHGGSGTTLGALAAGVPQLFLPHGADQFGNADVVTAAGAGRQLRDAEVTAESVATAAKALLTDSSYVDAAGAFAAVVAAMPDPAEVAAALPEHATLARNVCS